MRKVFLYSLLLVIGLVFSQMLSGRGASIIMPLTMIALAFIMIHVGYEFEIDKSRPRQYAWDYFVAACAASLPWLFCSLYFMCVMRGSFRAAAFEGLFAAPTSAGVLFSMLAAAGLGATWLFKKARILAIFDDLHTLILLIPLKAMMIGVRWQLVVVALVTIGLLYLAWRYLKTLRWPVTWPWVLGYALAIVALTESIAWFSMAFDAGLPIHIEVLLPAFALGCMLRIPEGQNPHCDDAMEGHEEGPESKGEQRIATIVSACFMVLVGLSMPSIFTSAAPALTASHLTPSVDEQAQLHDEISANANVDSSAAVRSGGAIGAEKRTPAPAAPFPGWGVIALHVLAITLLSNLGKMFPALCYRRQASSRERIALAIGMFPRGEVGAGVLVIALSYHLAGPSLTVAVLSLALNLASTGGFILVVKRLLVPRKSADGIK